MREEDRKMWKVFLDGEEDDTVIATAFQLRDTSSNSARITFYNGSEIVAEYLLNRVLGWRIDEE